MAIEVVSWVFKHSRSKNAERLVMLAVADACNSPDGTGAWLSNAALMAKTNLSERAVQNATAGCERLGELKIERNAGRGGVNRFRVVMAIQNPAESAPFSVTPQNLHPAESAPFSDGAEGTDAQASGGKGADSAGQGSDGKGADSAPGTVKNSSTKSSSTSKRRPKKPEEPREDVDRVCRYLAEWIVRNGSRRPTIGEKWRTEARLLIDKDKRTLDQIRNVIAWSQRSPFWKSVILSMTNLREHFDAIRLQMDGQNQQDRRGSGGNQPYRNPENQDEYDDWKKAPA